MSKEIALHDFEEVLRGLKIELRKIIYETRYLQSYNNVLLGQQESLNQLISIYKKQTTQGNIARNELLRLQSGLLALGNELNEQKTALNEQQKILKSLLNISPYYRIEIENNDIETIDPERFSLASLIDRAYVSRPDIKRGELQTVFFEKSLIYEKSQRVPDITLSTAYDRYGGVWKNFVGFGISFNLPSLNRNQGNIKAAKIGIEQSHLLDLQQRNIAQQEVAEAFSNYIQAYNFNKSIEANNLLTELDEMLDVYTKNFLNRNISMLEYLDFIETYKNNKQIVLSSRKNRCSSFEELQYTVGAELK